MLPVLPRMSSFDCKLQLDFRDIRRCGQYPASEYRYSDADSPAMATLTGVAPFIPFDYDTSSLSVTFQVWTLTNVSSAPIIVTL